MKDVLILGAGAAGAIIANKLARKLRRDIAKNKVKITVLDKASLSVNQAGFTFVPYGFYTPEDLVRPIKQIISPRVNVVLGKDGEVQRVNLKSRRVTVESGKEYSYDYLVIATGAFPDFHNVTGLSKDINTFYTTLEDAKKLGNVLKTFNGGHIVVLTVSMPIPCPGAPSKFSVLLDDYLRYVRGEEVRKNIEISYLWPIPLIGPPAYDKVISKVLAGKGIDYKREFKFAKVDEGTKEVVSADGERIKYDLLITIPPHKCLKALVDSGITDKTGWVPADKHTLQYRKSETEKYEEVYVLGDSGPAEILKTGIGVHYQALIVAQNLINELFGYSAKALYRGETGCPIVTSSYTGAKPGEAYLTTWTYDHPLGSFTPIKLGWFIYRMYYFIYWDTTIKALM
ncbi:MAG: NAD(P)/FAD-dependent oxidoreductase [Candidatus Hodarchaeota archaeon]